MESVQDKLKAIVLPLDKLTGLECDGMTRVISYELKKAGFSFQAYKGRLTPADFLKEGTQVLHYWIEIETSSLGEPLTIDLRARKWLGENPLVPHGVFKKSKYPGAIYTNAVPVDLTPSPFLYKLLVE